MAAPYTVPIPARVELYEPVFVAPITTPTIFCSSLRFVFYKRNYLVQYSQTRCRIIPGPTGLVRVGV